MKYLKKKERVDACFDGSRVTHIPVNKEFFNAAKIVSEYDQGIPQSQTADNPVAPRGRAAQPSRDNRKTN